MGQAFPVPNTVPPSRGTRYVSLASKVKEQIRLEEAPPTRSRGRRNPRQPQKNMDPLVHLGRQVSRKIEVGDFKGAIRLASSDDTLADFDESTYSTLKSKHPAPHPDTCLLPPRHMPRSTPHPCWSFLSGFSCDVVAAICSIPNGSAGGLDRLLPQHLKDLVQRVDDLEESPFLLALTDFCSLVLCGETPSEVRPFLWCIRSSPPQEVWWDKAHCCGLYLAPIGS